MFSRENTTENPWVRPTVDTGPGLTKQSHKKETDINQIMSKYQKTGVLNFVNKTAPEFMQVEPIDLQQAMNLVIRSNEMFGDMPSSLRKKFGNDPMEFLDFVNNPENLDEMVELGLATAPEPAPEPEPTPVEPPPA